MHILVNGAWRDGFLDWHRSPDEYRVEVAAMRNMQPVYGQYLTMRRTLHTVLTYLREVGPRDLWRRVRSRAAERGRNERYLSCGFGRVLEAPAGAPAAVGADVVFIATAHPACAERLVLPAALVRPVAGGLGRRAAAGVRHVGCDAQDDAWDALAGWSAWSGAPLHAASCATWLDRAEEALAATNFAGGAVLARSAAPAREVAPSSGPSSGPTGGASGGTARGAVAATLFGYGHYPKVTALPRLTAGVRVTAVHEIDPLQLPNPLPAGTTWDTAPTLRDDERPGVVLIAGYHHTHAALAVEALRRGAYAVVEKPICTTHTQLDALLAAMRPGPSRLFACFQRRYSPFNALARRDLGARRGDPIDYHCTVFEIPLPRLHWYRWPNARTRLLSNGSHWIDHFLHLNAFARPRRWTVDAAASGVVSATVELENGAYFSMTLTDHGSARTGVQDHVELRAGDRTVRVVDSKAYRAESTRRVLRRARAHKLAAFDAMYAAICRAVAAGAPGDDAAALDVSTRLVLDMDAALAARGAARGGVADRSIDPRRATANG